MNLLNFKDKLEKGKELGAEIVYIKEDNLLSGIECIYKNDDNSITLLKSEESSIKVNDFINILDDLYEEVGNVNIFIGESLYRKEDYKEIENLEFAQYESIKMIFINV